MYRQRWDLTKIFMRTPIRKILQHYKLVEEAMEDYDRFR